MIEPTAPQAGTKPYLLDLASLDLTPRSIGRERIARVNPHRGQMALLDYVVWHADDFKSGVGLWEVKPDEFWVTGHFPQQPLLPGVLQVEAGAQLSVFLYNSRFPVPRIAAFTRIEQCSFRGQVSPGDELLIVAKEIKANDRRFVSDIQGVVAGKVVFQAEIHGICLGDVRV